MSTTPETITGYQCTSCATVWDKEDLVRVYECGSCSTLSDERRCESCNKFMARAEHGEGCPDCFTECEEIESVVDHDGTLVPVEDYDPTGPSRAERDRATRDAEAASRAQAAKTEHDAVLARCTPTPWSQVTPGALLAPKSPTGFGYDTPVPVREVYPRPDGSVVVVTAEFSDPRIEVHPGDETVMVLPETDDQPPAGVAVVVAEQSGPVSSPARRCEVHVEVATLTREGALLPSLNMSLRGGSLFTPLAQWIDADRAREGLDQWEHAARTFTAELAKVEVAADPDYVGRVRVIDDGSYATTDRSMITERKVTIGVDPAGWAGTDAPVMVVQTGGSTVTLRDPQVLLDAVAAARELLDHLTLTPATREQS